MQQGTVHKKGDAQKTEAAFVECVTVMSLKYVEKINLTVSHGQL